MKYGLCKKLVNLLYEYYYDKDNVLLENDLLELIDQLEKTNYRDVYDNYKECVRALQSIRPLYNEKPYCWVSNVDSLKGYLYSLSIDISENRAERGIAYSERLGDYIYENGYDYYMTHGF